MIDKYRQFKPYADYLASLVRQNQGGISNHKEFSNISAALDGECSAELRNTVSLEVRRKDGVFFTGSSLSETAIQNKLTDINSNSVFCDPTCGVGDLLISAARLLPVEETLEETLIKWGHRLIGRDINPIFIDSARNRIALIAIQKGARSKNKKLLNLEKFLPEVKVGDGLKTNSKDYECVTHLLMNPPFSMKDFGKKCAWGSGKINSAAIFVEHCIKKSKTGTRLIAILPDVLRSGTRYEAWRKELVKNAFATSIDLYGTFDNSADVDVFILDAVISNEVSLKEVQATENKVIDATISDKFEVHVGPVVPFRNKGLGNWYPYIHARNVEPWGKISKISENVRFGGTVYKPPFVVIKRTSRYGDEHRAAAAIIAGRKAVAVENHLIVCIPKGNTLDDCQKLVAHLKKGYVTEWLNKRIRCRHLTVRAVKDIPWKDS